MVKKVLAIIAAFFTAVLFARASWQGYWGDTLIESASVFSAVYFGLTGWKDFLQVLSKAE